MRIVIIGCGRLGSGLAQDMILRGHTVSVVDRDPQAFQRLSPGFKGKTVQGVGFDREVLRQAGIERADGLAAVTNSDETNLIAARIAKQIFRVPSVVAGLYDPERADIYEHMGLHTIAPITWGITRIADLLLTPQMDVTTHIGSGDVSLVRAEAPQTLIGRTVNTITVPGEIHVVAITRSGKTFLPNLGTVVRDNDMIHIAVLSSSSSLLEQMLSGQAGG